MSIQIYVCSLKELLADMEVIEEAEQDYAIQLFCNLLNKYTKSSNLDCETRWEGKTYDFLNREFEVLSGLVRLHAPECSAEIGSDAYIPMLDLTERFLFRYTFPPDTPELELEVRDLASLENGLAVAARLEDKVPPDFREQFRETLNTHRDAIQLARKNRAVLLYSY